MTAGIRLTFEEVRDHFKEQGCELLETEYVNARTKLRYRCGCGEESQIVFDSFKRGNRCRRCGNSKAAAKQSLSHEEVAAYFKSQGCELLETYKASRVPMEYRCSCGRISKINWNNFKSKGRRCKDCGVEKRSSVNHYMWYADRDYFKQLRSFKDRCHKLVTISLAQMGKVKNDNTKRILGYDYNDLQAHITNHPNWPNVKDGPWHVDHIFPIKAFVEHGILDLKIINALDNLRPLGAIPNMVKNAKYDKKEFSRWLAGKGIQLKDGKNET